MIWIPRRKKRVESELHFDEILLDSSNLPSFDQQQFEGRLEKPISKITFYILGMFFLLVGLSFGGRVGLLQIKQGEAFAHLSENNTLRAIPIFAERGVIYDRNNVELAWNDPELGRRYKEGGGFGHLLGYLGFPTVEQLAKQANKYDPKQLIGKDGIESFYERELGGEKGIKLEEIDVNGNVTSNNVLEEPQNGEQLVLAVDADVQQQLYKIIKDVADSRGFQGGGGVLMDVSTGEVLALASYPEYDPNIMTERSDATTISGYFKDKSEPFLNRVVSGLYTPGSIFKPIVAAGALQERVIDPGTKILSTGQLVVPNPYDSTKNTVFKDWKAHGWTNMREALAVSSDVYFYEVGGGSPRQKGLGIANIDKYARVFGLAELTGIDLFGEAKGEIPTPAWKAEHFDGEPWRLGNTYHTAIGQYGVQVTPLQMVRAIAAIASGRLLKPMIALPTGATEFQSGTLVKIDPSHLKVVREGMRLAVTNGTAAGLNVSSVSVAAKTGTAELGTTKASVNSWVVGFFPFEQPRYAFAVVMEKGDRHNTVGGVFVIRQLLDWLSVYKSEYLKP
jgi:penicillin-binding protein 2